MGANSSTLIDDLHTSAQLPDEEAVSRKLRALQEVQEVGKSAEIAVQIVEQGGMQPLLRCYNAAHPHVRIEAAKALAVLAVQPSNQREMGMDDVLPQYHPALLTASLDFREHAMALLAQLATPEVNKLKLAHEGLVSPIINAVTAPREPLQLHALDALAKLCTVPQIAELAVSRGVLASLLRAARSPKPEMKLRVVRVMTGLAVCKHNVSPFITSGSIIFLMGCTYCGPEVQLEVARCLQNLLGQVFDSKTTVSEREAQMLTVMAAIEVSPERIIDDSAMTLDVRSAMEMPMVELIPELVQRTKKLINCDRASIFVLSPGGKKLTTILAENTEQIEVDVEGVNSDGHPASVAGECAKLGQTIKLRQAYSHPSFNQAIDRKTGYHTRSLLAMPIRKPGADYATNGAVLGVVQCINKQGSAHDYEAVDEDGVPVFSAADEQTLSAFCRQIAPILEKVTLKKRAPKSKYQLGTDWVQNIAMLAQLDVYTVIKVMLDRMRDLVDGDRASLFVLDKKRKELWSKIADNLPEIRVKSNAGIVGAVATSGIGELIDDAYKDSRFNRRIDAATGYRTRTIICLPMKNQRGDVVGVVQCINKRSGTPFTQEDHSNLDEFVFQTSSMLEFKAATRDEGNTMFSETPTISTGDGVALLLHLVQSKEVDIQLHAAGSIGVISRNEANRERVVALGGVPVLLQLAMPFPWVAADLLKGISLSMANLTMSPAVRQEAEAQGGWTALLVLAREFPGPGLKAVPEAWFDALRALANLALRMTLQKQMVAKGALDIALEFARKSDPDLRAQAVRLAANLSPCTRCPDDTDDEGIMRIFSRPEVVRTLGAAAAEAAAERDSVLLPTYAASYAKLSLVPNIALWCFDVAGVGVLESFAMASGSMADDMRVHMGTCLANCLRNHPGQRLNQRIVLEMNRSTDKRDAEYAQLSTVKQREVNLKERDALSTGKTIRQLMELQLYSKTSNPSVYVQYSKMLEMLAREPANHTCMLAKGYVQQLIQLADTIGPQGEAQAVALRGLRHLATAEDPETNTREIADILDRLVSMRIVPILMTAANAPHEDSRYEVCELVKILAAESIIADKMVKHVYTPAAMAEGRSTMMAGLKWRRVGQTKPSVGTAIENEKLAAALKKKSESLMALEFSELEWSEIEVGHLKHGHYIAASDTYYEPVMPPQHEAAGIPFLAVIGSLLVTNSARLQKAACLALRPFAKEHKVPLCQAKVVGSLINLSQSPDEFVSKTAGGVLQLLAERGG